MFHDKNLNNTQTLIINWNFLIYLINDTSSSRDTNYHIRSTRGHLNLKKDMLLCSCIWAPSTGLNNPECISLRFLNYDANDDSRDKGKFILIGISVDRLLYNNVSESLKSRIVLPRHSVDVTWLRPRPSGYFALAVNNTLLTHCSTLPLQ